MHDYEKYEGIVREANRYEEMKRAAGLISPMHEEMKRIEEMQKLCEVPDYLKTSGLVSSWLEEQKRIEEMQKAITAPSGIAGKIIEDMARIESSPHYLYPTPHNVPVDIPVLQPIRDPMRETNRNLKETKALQEKIAGHLEDLVNNKNETELQNKMAGHLEELVSQAKGTTEQNVRMIKLSTASLIVSLLSIVVGIVCYYAGKSSSVPASVPQPTVVKSAPVPAQTHINKNGVK